VPREVVNEKDDSCDPTSAGRTMENGGRIHIHIILYDEERGDRLILLRG